MIPARARLPSGEETENPDSSEADMQCTWRSFPVFLAALAGCEGPDGAPASRVKNLFGSEPLAIIAGATDAEAYRIEGNAMGPPAGTGDGPRLGQFPIRSGPVRLEEALLRQLKEVLFDEASYEWELPPKACILNPGVGVRYRQGGRKTHLYLCFECEMLGIGPPGSESWEDFDPANAKLARLVKEVFPADPEIQALKE